MSEDWINRIHQGDAVEVLGELPESSVHCVMTSPPYYGLRDYGVDGQIGLEESLDEYVASIVEVAEELRRVLRQDGSWWLNLGDSFAGSWGGQGYDGPTKNNAEAHPEKNPARNASLRRKTKMLVPHRVAIALQDAGWIVRSDAVWSKPNPMPHPVKDRLHEHKEFLFHLTPEPDYWFDLDVDQPELLLEDDAQTTLVQPDGGEERCSLSTDTDRGQVRPIGIAALLFALSVLLGGALLVGVLL